MTARLGVQLLLSVPAAVLFVAHVGAHASRCGIGINAAANRFGLVLFDLPAMVGVLAAEAAAGYALSSRSVVGGLVGMTGGYLAVALILWTYRDYPQARCSPGGMRGAAEQLVAVCDRGEGVSAADVVVG